MKTQTVEIAGAGLTGLMAAARMAQLGWKVTLHERSPDLRMFGAGIWMWENGLKSLQVVGAYDDAVRRAKHIKEWRCVDQDERVLMSRTFNDRDKLLLPPRADLYQALIDRVVELGVEIKTSSVVTGVDPSGTLTLETGEVRRADLILAADGAWSRLREQLNCSRFADFGVESGIRMMIDRKDGDPDDVITENWHGPYRLLFNPCVDNENYIFLAAPVEEMTSDKKVDRELWARMFPHCRDYVERFAEAGRWDRIIAVVCRRWSSGKVAIVGDAAHAMPPNLGQAANTAFVNVLALATEVTGTDDIPAALDRWETRQRALTDHVQRWSYVYGLLAGHWPSAFGPMRTDFIQSMTAKPWFQAGLNRGAYHIPDGYVAGA
ncbi:FAD-dependent monooxygenase [Zavarzinia compransoris]|uniref:FAD-dependent oxidoreductase n=1 Tax=Zavarzinia marina TaxID=2911065 RepID=UPI001F420658|nr:NAD(P)/FAD-dependent oxidoreductase [Zavarzinia marina]MCF4167363.1 FAD-dependent monooxygenase [Zavarzinia marina]